MESIVADEKYEIKVGNKQILMNFNDVIFTISTPYPPDTSEDEECQFCDTTDAPKWVYCEFCGKKNCPKCCYKKRKFMAYGDSEEEGKAEP